jgi:hypothetical protein
MATHLGKRMERIVTSRLDLADDVVVALTKHGRWAAGSSYPRAGLNGRGGRVGHLSPQLDFSGAVPALTGLQQASDGAYRRAPAKAIVKKQ